MICHPGSNGIMKTKELHSSQKTLIRLGAEIVKMMTPACSSPMTSLPPVLSVENTTTQGYQQLDRAEDHSRRCSVKTRCCQQESRYFWEHWSLQLLEFYYYYWTFLPILSWWSIKTVKIIPTHFLPIPRITDNHSWLRLYCSRNVFQKMLKARSKEVHSERGVFDVLYAPWGILERETFCRIIKAIWIHFECSHKAKDTRKDQ